MTDTTRVTTVTSNRAAHVELTASNHYPVPSIVTHSPDHPNLPALTCQWARASSHLASRRTRPLRVAIVVDSPNLGRTVDREWGQGYRVDWAAVMQIGRSLGNVVRAIVVTNAGFPLHLSQKIEQTGFSCTKGTDQRDCDDRVVVALVQAAACHAIDVLLLGSGDHAYVSAMRLARFTAKELYVVSTAGSCADALRATVRHVFEIPTKKRLCNSLAAASRSAATRAEVLYRPQL